MLQLLNINKSDSGYLCFKAGRTEARIKDAFPKAPITKAFETPPTLLIIKGAVGLAKAQTRETSARL